MPSLSNILFYKENDYNVSTEIDNALLDALAEGRLQVCELAKLYYQTGIEIGSTDNQEAIYQTAKHLEKDDVNT